MKTLALSLLVAASALAAPRPARDTAAVGQRGAASVGLFNPLRVAIADGIELEANPLVFFVAPNLNSRFRLLDGRFQLTAEAGLSLPTFGMRLMKGFFFPSWETSSNDIGWMLVPRLGVVFSGSAFEHDVWTVKADAALRVPLGPNSATPLNSFVIPLDLLLAAPLTGFCARVGGAWDHAFGERLRLRGEANLFVTGAQGTLVVSGQPVGPIAPISNVVVTAHLGLDIAVFQQSRVTVGVLWANADQGASQVVRQADGFSERVRGRSNNILPTVDYIWAWY
ncbi:MAG: hypothetical protein INH41_31750 [Myxococcaceae bacterium]|jgi:hypothetical protein|nr:hypothetical protein [Myxococcaceae bacterium]MCA3016981.1 hypothetical protein [Myxococcaceae bacterium]